MAARGDPDPHCSRRASLWTLEKCRGFGRIERFPVSDLVCGLRAWCLLCAWQSTAFVVRSNLLCGSSMTDFRKQSFLAKVIVARLVKIFFAHYGTLITTAWNWDPSCVRPRPVCLLCTQMCLGAPNAHFPSGVSPKVVHPFCISFVLHVASITSPFNWPHQ